MIRGLKVVKKEFNKLYWAWVRFLDDNLFAVRLCLKRRLSRISPLQGDIILSLLFVSSFLVGLMWLFKGVGYAQPGYTADIYAHPAIKFFFWITSGSFLTAFLRFIHKSYGRFKRTCDFVVSGIALILLSPLFFIISLVIKIDSSGPVFFRQHRIGQNKNTFNIWKFRTMRHNAELETGPIVAQENDPRITIVGRFLRASLLDKMPQLINVFKGEMSLVGPTAQRPEFFAAGAGAMSGPVHALDVKPGITGLAQIRYDEASSIKESARRFRYDLIYARRMCWLLDIQIIFLTITRILTGVGAR